MGRGAWQTTVYGVVGLRVIMCSSVPLSCNFISVWNFMLDPIGVQFMKANNSYLQILKCIQIEERQNLFSGVLGSKIYIKVNTYIVFSFCFINLKHVLTYEV